MGAVGSVGDVSTGSWASALSIVAAVLGIAWYVLAFLARRRRPTEHDRRHEAEQRGEQAGSQVSDGALTPLQTGYPSGAADLVGPSSPAGPGDPQSAVAVWEAALENSDTRIRRAAVKELVAAQAVGALTKALENADYNVRREAAVALADLRVRDALMKMLNNEDFGVRRIAAEALSKVLD